MPDGLKRFPKAPICEYRARMLHQDLYRTVLENLPTGVYVVDRERRILFWNDGAEQITG